MSGESNHCFCRNALRITPCTVSGTLYDTGYGYPAFVPCGGNAVRAELIEIPFEDWTSVDQLEGYPELYGRRIISAELCGGTEDSGWIYIMQTLPQGAEVIPCGDWKKHRVSC